MVTTPNIEAVAAEPRRRWVAALILLWTLVVVVAGIWLIDSSQRRAVEQLQSDAQARAAHVRDRIEADLELLRALPAILASQVNARTVLLRAMRNPDDPILSDSLNAQYARIARLLSVETIFLAGADGDILAAHSLTTSNPQQLLGQNASERAYFRAAAAGQAGEHFAIAQSSGLPSVFFSAPVLENDTFIGAVVVRATTDRMRHVLDLGGSTRAWLVDDYQVVIAATDTEDYLRRLGQSAPLSESVAPRYGGATPDEQAIALLDHRRIGTVQTVATNADEGPFVQSTAKLNDGRWAIHVLLDTTPVALVTRQWRVALTLIWLVGALIMLLLVRSVRHVQDLDRLANIDVLSGLGNRRLYDSVIESLCDAHNRGRIQHIALALFNLDHFKQINDKQGHAAGDRAIELFAEQLFNSTRRMDHIFRLGGDEFAALILELTPKTAEQALLGIQARLRLVASANDELRLPTVSIGLAYHRDGESPDALYQRADRALYAAKSSGRNRLHVAGHDEA